MTAALFCMPTCLTVNAATFTWDGGGGNNNWTTATNWVSDTTPTSSSDIVFAGTTRLNVNSQWGTSLNSITFASGAGAFTISGGGYNLGAGGITNNSSNTQTITDQISLSASQTWTAASGNIVTGTNYFNANSHNFTLAGSHNITIAGALGNAATLSLTGSGNRTFSSTNTLSATTLSASNTGTNTFAGQVNATTLNLSSGTSYFNHTGTAAQIGSGGVNISGTASAIFNGNVGSAGSYNITSSGNIDFVGNITSGNLNLNGSGVTTISGASNNISTTTVNSGTLVMDSSGTSTNGPLVVNGGTVIMAGDNQVPTWSSVTLTGGTLDLNDTSQTITNLTITDNAIIDFGGSGSTLSVTGTISIADGITITIKNWNDTMDVFSGTNPGDSVVVNIEYADNDGTVYATGTWGGGFITPGSPVPEPATYGALLVGGLIGIIATSRRERRQSV